MAVLTPNLLGSSRSPKPRSRSTSLGRTRQIPRLEDFDILRPISKGAFGKVYLAKKRTTGDTFAAKVVDINDMRRKNLMNQVLAERNAMALARSDFVVRLFYTFRSAEHFVLVMEYMPGGDLSSLLGVYGCFEVPMARFYVAQLSSALEYLHQHKVIHRDIKPDNILIDAKGHIRLTDFGLSQQLDRAATLRRKPSGQRPPTVPGSPDYVARELVLGLGGTDDAVDWWAAGVVLFELLAGYTPFMADSPEEIFANIVQMSMFHLFFFASKTHS
ncbi:kinase-like domain-containing protein [Blastocladiella britannica]|nr:kinase-like domain-containing protein [Blastocladiella britannica]